MFIHNTPAIYHSPVKTPAGPAVFKGNRDSVRFGANLTSDTLAKDFNIKYSSQAMAQKFNKTFSRLVFGEYDINSYGSPRAHLFKFMKARDFKPLAEGANMLQVSEEDTLEILKDVLGFEVVDPDRGLPEFIYKLLYIQHVLGFNIQTLTNATSVTLERIATQFESLKESDLFLTASLPKKIPLSQLAAWVKHSHDVSMTDKAMMRTAIENKYGPKLAGDFVSEPFARDFIIPALFGLQAEELEFKPEFYQMYWSELTKLTETGDLDRYKLVSLPLFVNQMKTIISEHIAPQYASDKIISEKFVVSRIIKHYGHAPIPSPANRIEIAEFILKPLKREILGLIIKKRRADRKVVITTREPGQPGDSKQIIISTPQKNKPAATEEEETLPEESDTLAADEILSHKPSTPPYRGRHVKED